MLHLNKEQFKTLLLILLFGLSIALTQRLWMDIPLDWSMFSTVPAEKTTKVKSNNSTVEVSDVLSPQSFTVNFGGGLHTVLYVDAYNIWKKTLNIFKDQHFIHEIAIKKIEEDQWIKANNVRSIRMNFACSIPIAALTKLVEAEDNYFDEVLVDFYQILISLVDKRDIYITNSTKKKYYRITEIENSKNHIALSEVVNTIEASEYVYYYPIQDIYGVNNMHIMPIEQHEYLPKLAITKEIDSRNDGQVEAFASTFFGENFDFVRKIRETSGSVIYMYGYGQKTLEIDVSGVVEYKEEIDTQKVGNSTSFWDSFQAAFQFVQKHGSWSNIDATNIYAYLEKIVPIEKDKNTGYQFIFGYRLNDLPVYYHHDQLKYPIEVRVIGKQVLYYRRFLCRQMDKVNYFRNISNEEGPIMLGATHVLNKNFEILKNNYIKDMKRTGKPKDEEIIKNQMLSSIQFVTIGYYNDSIKGSNELIPIWIIKVGDYVYYFDIYTGQIIEQFQDTWMVK